jgi:hypothetical protein
MVRDPPSKPTASWIVVELRVADRVAGGADCSSEVEIVSAWKRRLDVPRGCGLMNRGLGVWIRFGAVACAVEVVVDIKIMDGREKMTEPKPAAKNGRGPISRSAGNWQLATGNVPDLHIHSTLARVFMQLLWATVET